MRYWLGFLQSRDALMGITGGSSFAQLDLSRQAKRLGDMSPEAIL
jgi:hypothetical protein